MTDFYTPEQRREYNRKYRLAHPNYKPPHKKKRTHHLQEKTKNLSIKEEIERWEEQSKEYWNGKNDMPQSKVLQILIMKYGEPLAVKIQEAWSIICKDILLQLWLTREMGE